MDILYGTKVYDRKKKQIGILIKTYNLQYVDNPNLMGAKIVDPQGKIYPANLDNITPVNDLTDEELKELDIPEWLIR